jgi:intracellular septation protein
MLKFLSEFGPLIAFFVAYKYGNIQSAALYMLLASIIGITLCYLIERKIQTFSLVSSGVLLVSAGFTLISGNPVFIKVKPTILYIIFGSSFLVSALQKRPVMKYLLSGAISLQEKCWNILSYRFSLFFLLMAIANELVWRNCDEAAWVKFKVFGALPITLLFILLQVPFLLKNKLPDKTTGSV